MIVFARNVILTVILMSVLVEVLLSQTLGNCVTESGSPRVLYPERAHFRGGEQGQCETLCRVAQHTRNFPCITVLLRELVPTSGSVPRSKIPCRDQTLLLAVENVK